MRRLPGSEDIYSENQDAFHHMTFITQTIDAEDARFLSNAALYI